MASTPESPPPEKVYEMVISDDFLSPDSEVSHNPYPEQHSHSDVQIGFCPVLPRVATTRSMENVVLDTSPMEESIDLGSESLMDRSLPMTGSGLGIVEDESSEVPTSNSSQRAMDDSTLESSAGNTELDEAIDVTSSKVLFDDIVEPSDNLIGVSSHSAAALPDNIDGKNDGRLSPAPDLADANIDILSGDNVVSVDFSTGSTTVDAVDDALPVGFVEEKGLRVAQSSKSLSKFFENEETGMGTDVEGKSFFDSFTTGDEDPISATPGSLMVSPRILDHNPSLPGSVSGSSSPHVSVSGPFSSLGSNPSPIRRISESSTPVFHFQPSLSVEASMSNPADTDPFSSGIFSSDIDRRYDAWIPNELTRLVLMTVLTNTAGSSLPVHQTVAPAVIVEESLGDPIQEMVQRFMGEQEAAKRLVLNADSVPQDEVGLRQLIKAECLRSAIDLTSRLLTQCGQGPGSQSAPAKHTPYSLQLWFCRLSLLVKLHLFSSAEAEMEQFGDLDTPDLYHEYYVQSSGALRRGSMVPFDMRVLHAELPHHVSRSQDTLDRLCYLLSVIKQMLLNLDNGLAEDGSMLELNEASRTASKELWSVREIRVLYSLGNCLVNNKDYITAIKIYKSLLEKDLANEANLLSGIGRIYLQMGDAKMAAGYFELAEGHADKRLSENSSTQTLMNRGLLQLGNNNFLEAYEIFKKLVEVDPSNVVVGAVFVFNCLVLCITLLLCLSSC
jgi:tetratricopeptide (TPR) repeat protein